MNATRGAKGRKAQGAPSKALSKALAAAVAAGVRDGQVFEHAIDVAVEIGAELPEVKESTLAPMSPRQSGARLSRSVAPGISKVQSLDRPPLEAKPAKKKTPLGRML